MGVPQPEQGAGAAAAGPVPAGPVLVLNASMEPLSVVAARRAVVLVLTDRAAVIEEDGAWFRSASIAMRAPTVVRLQRQVRVPHLRGAGLTRRGIFLRDGGCCQYCGSPAEDVDHIVPRSRGGTHTWENVVAACRRCNAGKRDRTLHEAGLRLAGTPRTPPPVFWLVARAEGVIEGWRPFLVPYLGRRWEPALDLACRWAV